MEKNFNEERDRRLGVIDPLGVIENLAKSLWKDHGEISGTTWRDHFADAEQLLLAGRSGPAPTQPDPPEKTMDLLPTPIWALRDQDDDPIARAIARSIDRLLTAHESYCLGYLLIFNEFNVRATPELIAFSEERVAHILAMLSAEYDDDFIKREGGLLSSVSPEARTRYWTQKLIQWREADEALTYSDRNTIDRFTEALRVQPEVENIRLRER